MCLHDPFAGWRRGVRLVGRRGWLCCVAPLVWLLVLGLLPPGQATAQQVPVQAVRVVYVAFGDSLTFGFGADHRATDNYPALLARHLPTGSRVLNLGIPGITVADAIDQELPSALAAHPTLATVWLGYNDITLATPPAAYAVSLARMLAALQKQHARIFVANMPNPRLVPITALNPDDHLTKKYNVLIASTAAHFNATVIDVYANTRAVWGRSGQVSDDDVHLTTKGYAALAHVFFQALSSHGAL